MVDDDDDNDLIEGLHKYFFTVIISLLRWSDVCQMAAVALREVITAAQQGAFPMQHVKDQLDCLCYHLCCLPICVATWLSSHVQVNQIMLFSHNSFTKFEYSTVCIVCYTGPSTVLVFGSFT